MKDTTLLDLSMGVGLGRLFWLKPQLKQTYLREVIQVKATTAADLSWGGNSS